MENKLTYTKVGDYYIPNLTIKPSPPIGKYGRMRRDYLRDHRPALYNRLILREQLQEHCAEINEANSHTFDKTLNLLVNWCYQIQGGHFYV